MCQPTNLLELYTGQDLAILFKGGFINFGYWDNITNKQSISSDDFIHANTALYRKILEQLSIKTTDRLLEVGSCFGAGCGLIAEFYQPQSIIGVDHFQAHVDRANTLQKKWIAEKKISFVCGNAENLPILDRTIDKLVTLEAFQHFQPIAAINEFARVLANNGTLVLSTFFALNKKHFKEILKLIPRPAILSDHSDETHAALPEVLLALQKSGFAEIELISIGKYVWPGYDQWVRQNKPDIWDINWLHLYNEGLLDYFIIKARQKG